MKKVCTFIIILVLTVCLAGSGCTEKIYFTPASENLEKAFEGKYLTVCA